MADDVRQWQALRGMGLKAFWLFLMQGAAVRSVCGFWNLPWGFLLDAQ